MVNKSIFDAKHGEFLDEFEASIPAKSELKYDLMHIEEQMPRPEHQEIFDRLRSIDNFNDLEPQLSLMHAEPSDHRHLSLIGHAEFLEPFEMGATAGLRNRSLTFHADNNIFGGLGATAMEMQHLN